MKAIRKTTLICDLLHAVVAVEQTVGSMGDSNLPHHLGRAGSKVLLKKPTEVTSRASREPSQSIHPKVSGWVLVHVLQDTPQGRDDLLGCR